jgi:hypothetical protein
MKINTFCVDGPDLPADDLRMVVGGCKKTKCKPKKNCHADIDPGAAVMDMIAALMGTPPAAASKPDVGDGGALTPTGDGLAFSADGGDSTEALDIFR